MENISGGDFGQPTVLPANNEAEQSVLGAVLLDSECLNRILDIVRPEYFYNENHREIFSAMHRLFRAGSPVDIITVLNELVGIGVFRASGAMDYLIDGIRSGIELTGMNSDFVGALPTALMKPLSGSGARGMMVDAMTTYGADSFIGRLSCIFQGSTDTTFYILAVYFGSVGIVKTRHAVACGLLADLAGIIAAILIAYFFFG